MGYRYAYKTRNNGVNDRFNIADLYSRKIFEEISQKDETLAEIEKTKTEAYQKIMRCKYYLLHSHPFYSFVAANMKFREVDPMLCNTMGVDKVGDLWYNKEFVLNEVSESELSGVICHEVMHNTLFTFSRESGRNHKIWNYATDYTINRIIIRDGLQLPENGCNSVKVDNKWLIKRLLTPQADKWVEIEPPIDITYDSAEIIYNKIINAYQERNINPYEESGKGSSGGSSEGSDKGPGGILITVDDHDLRNKLPPTREVSDTEWGKRIKDAIERTIEATKGKGTGSIGAEEAIAEMGKPKINWRSILRRIFTKFQVLSNIRKPHTKSVPRGYIIPTKIRTPLIQDIYIAIDTSGSIGKKEYNLFITETIGLIRSYKANITVLFWSGGSVDSGVTSVDITPKNANELLHQKVVSGGTEIRLVKEWFTQNKIKDINALIYFTDGEVGSITSDDIPQCKSLAFIITPDGTTKEVEKIKNATVAQMNH